MIKFKKFIEVTERGDKRKVLVAVDKIISITEEENGLAYIEYFISADISMGFGVRCLETYVEIFNLLCECELI